jgi:hypothetical protein
MKSPERLRPATRPAKRWPGWLVAFVLGVPMLIAGYVLWTTYFAPLPTKGAGEMVQDFLKGSASFSEALATAGREEGRAHVYMRFKTEQAGVQRLVQDFGLVQAEATAAQIGAIRSDERMPEWWRPQLELAPGQPMWTGARDGWFYELYFAPATGVTYFEWTWQ